MLIARHVESYSPQEWTRSGKATPTTKIAKQRKDNMGAILDALFGPSGPGREAERQAGTGATMAQAAASNARGFMTGANHSNSQPGSFTTPEYGSRTDAQLLTDDAANQMGYEVWF